MRRTALTIATLLLTGLAACGGPSGGGGVGGGGFVSGDTGSPGGGPGGGFGGDCTPSCEGRTCGDDNCGGSCGGCGAQVCANYQCYDPSEVPADAVITPEPDAGGPGDGDAGGGDPTQDLDSDLIFDVNDNCKLVANPGQEDLDGDGVGDACDEDIDGDGTDNEDDCGPTNPDAYIGALEKCNGIDDDCDGQTDEGVTEGCTTYYQDLDGDGTGKTSTATCLCAPSETHTATAGGDCNDADPSVSPWVTEVCDNLDNNCNSLVDEGCDDDSDGWCDATMQVVGSPNVCPKGGGDCFDYSALISPDAPETFGDGFDNDCNGEVDEAAECAGPCTGNTVEAYLCSLEMCFGSLIESAKFSSPTGDTISSAWAAVNHFGNANNDLAPFGGTSYALLATGTATGTNHSVDLPGGGSTSDPFAKDGYPTYDAVEFTIVMTAPDGALGFSLDYIFFSEEYEEYIGTSYNDKFYIILNAPQTTGGQKQIINYTDCSNPNAYHDFIDGQGKKRCYIAINTAFSEPCGNVQTNIKGTGYECGAPDQAHGSSTGWLTTSWPIQGGEKFTLTIHIHDSSDPVYDSEVILDNFRFDTTTVTPGTTHK